MSDSTQTLLVDGVNVRYRDSGGAGPAVLMLHGVGGSLELWAEQFALANQGLRLIALDLPGHGLSDFGHAPYTPSTYAQFVWRFVDGLGLEQVHLAGNSMGGAISLQMLAQQPARVSSMLLAASATLGRKGPLPFRLMNLPLLGALMTRAGPMAIQQQLQAIFGPSYVVPEEVRRVVTRNVMRPGAQAAFLTNVRQLSDLGGQRATLISQARAALASATAPVLLLHGRQDRVISFAHSQNTHQQVPACQLQLIDDCGHTPQLERPGIFNDALQALVASA